MKLVISDAEKLESWETLINTVDKTDIPIEFVRRINIVFKIPVDGKDERDIDITAMRDNGWDNDNLEDIVTQVFSDYDVNIQSIHFYLDIEHVAEVVQRQTNILLEGTK